MTIPSNIYLEKQINLFMMVENKYLQNILQVDNEIETMKKLRELKNSGKGIQ